MIGRRARTWVAIVIAAASIAACSGIPTSGPVIVGDEVVPDSGDQIIRVIARPPAPGMGPTEVVEGFLQASASFEGDHAVARLYLAPEAAALWDPSAGTTVYEGVPDLQVTDARSVAVTATLAGEIGAEGGFEVSPPGNVVETSFLLTQVNGEWRIALPPTGLLLSRADVDRAFRAYQVYYLDPTFTTLVPDPRLVPVSGPGVATSLAQMLVAGPTEWLAPAVRTGFRDGTSVSAVPIVNGVAQVDLDERYRLVDDETRQVLSAQLVWTLRQIPGIDSILITAGGQTLTVPGVPSPQPRDSWLAFDPNLMPPDTAPYLVSAGRVLRQTATGLTPIAGDAGLAEVPLQTAGISLASTVVAGLDERGALWMGQIEAGAPMTRVIQEPSQSQPSFGRGDQAWVVGPDGVVRRASLEGDITEVSVEGLATRASVEAVTLSRDGTRAAMIVRRGPRTLLNLAVVIAREAGVALSDPIRVEARLTEVIDVAWADDDRLLLLGIEGAGALQVFEVDLTRSTLRSLGAPIDPVRVAGAPGQPLLAGSADGSIYTYSGGQWRSLTEGQSPTYPG